MYSIALDGPAGVGKSTIAKLLAERLNYVYVDTGALYRAIAVYFLDNGLNAESVSTSDDEVTVLLSQIEVEIRYIDENQHVFINDTDVTGRLRTEDVSKMASVSSALPKVRAKLLELQRDMAKKYNVIMDGRDIGTVVLPGATLKIFLTARPEVRAMRRYKQLLESGKLGDQTLEELTCEIEERDHRDSTRAIAPLKPAEDSVIIDSSELMMEEEVNLIISYLEKKIEG
ncbi:MAG: (d)CMP kinase [Eubacteriales bacterium]|nr:(d)CMP kinase [Eubacteriales bacterium]